jgi:hypothetical protein
MADFIDSPSSVFIPQTEQFLLLRLLRETRALFMALLASILALVVCLYPNTRFVINLQPPRCPPPPVCFRTICKGVCPSHLTAGGRPHSKRCSARSLRAAGPHENFHPLGISLEGRKTSRSLPGCWGSPNSLS